jgi:thioredoxin reductase (NADPH)
LTGQQETTNACWLFLCLGGLPNTNWAAEVGLVRDEQCYLVTGPDLRKHCCFPATWPLDREPYYLETSFPGMFAAGDVRHGSVKRCASAVGEGAMAVTFVHRYLAGH